MKTKIFYDGACHLCAREIDHYKKIDTENRIEYVDIADPNFNALEEDLDPKMVNKYLHVKDKEGNPITGVDAFIEIWKELPQYNWLAKLAKAPLISPAMRIGYKIFAEIRPHLPKKKNHCSSGACTR